MFFNQAFNFLQCDPEQRGSCDSGCNGGLMNNAFEYALKTGGLVKEEDYPYTGTDGTCKLDTTKIVASVANFSVVSLDEDQIAANLVKNGPLASNDFLPQSSSIGMSVCSNDESACWCNVQLQSMPCTCKPTLEEYHAHTSAQSVKTTASC